jgi:glutathione S-transferase
MLSGVRYMELVIGNKNYSTWSLRAWLLLDAFELSYTEIQVSLVQENIKERLGKYSDTSRVPVLIDGSLKVWDSLAICEYISENYLDGAGWPEKAKDRAIARSICAEMHSGFAALRAELPMNCRAKRKVDVSAAAKADIRRIEEIWSKYAAESEDGEIRLFGRFSIADCFFAPVVLRFMTYGISLSAKAEAYANSLLQHRSVVRWVTLAKQETEIVVEDEAGEEEVGES